MQDLKVNSATDNRELLDNNATIKPKNFFTIQYEDEEPIDFLIGDNIQANAPIIKFIKKFDIGEKFDYNGELINLIYKDI